MSPRQPKIDESSSRPRRARSLRFEIMACFVAVVGLVGLAGIGLLYGGGRQVFESWMIRSNRFLAGAVRRQLEQALERGMKTGVALARKLEATPDEAGARHLVRSYLEFGDLFSNAYLYDGEGRLRLAEYRTGDASGTARAGESFREVPGPFAAVAERVLATGEPELTPMFQSRSGRSQMAYAIPVSRGAGQPPGLLSLGLFADSEQVNHWLSGLEPGRQGYIAVLDRHGRVIALTGTPPPGLARLASAGRDAARGGAGAAGSAPGAAAELSSPLPSLPPPGRGVLPGQPGITGDDLVLQDHLPELGFRVWVGLPREVAYRPLSDLRIPGGVAFLAALALAGLGGVLLSRRIVGPLQELVGGIRRVNEGVLSHRVPEDGGGELGEAARAFNRMAERLHRDQLVEEVWREVDRS